MDAGYYLMIIQTQAVLFLLKFGHTISNDFEYISIKYGSA